MSNNISTNLAKRLSSLGPTNGARTVGDGAFSHDADPSVLAVCRAQGFENLYYYSTTFSGGAQPVRYSLSPTLPITPGSTPNSSTESLQLSQLAPYPAGTGRINSTAFRQPAPSSIPATPPLTPDSGSGTGIAALAAKHNHEALDLLQALFPRDALKALPFARSVKIQSNGLGAVWNGIILDMPVKGGDSRKTLYVDGKGAEHVQLRESIVALLDLADERFGCSAFVIALDRKTPALGDLLHSLMYVSGTIVTNPPFPVDPSFVLVGIEM
ncbi:hypothetical protein EXIGLDRAFT_639696 [Exidia glandulosa HHB12029]|uniref:Ornithine decarboxylase antizyme n=1 Tax=Exidia glandulosa HHB12029 TaxID=1314781 RepID=A0A165N6D4_EXIGL|nr:hypothetical protein EXIGLDRAFT_639696 [Exidia glandulosa HHB12029]